jgi:hypothetical protein
MAARVGVAQRDRQRRAGAVEGDPGGVLREVGERQVPRVDHVEVEVDDQARCVPFERRQCHDGATFGIGPELMVGEADPPRTITQDLGGKVSGSVSS